MPTRSSMKLQGIQMSPQRNWYKATRIMKSRVKNAYPSKIALPLNGKQTCSKKGPKGLIWKLPVHDKDWWWTVLSTASEPCKSRHPMPTHSVLALLLFHILVRACLNFFFKTKLTTSWGSEVRSYSSANKRENQHNCWSLKLYCSLHHN